ncbi:MAG: CRISPR-associated endonuclease/helicase Cas3 [Chloroflexi bacterium]|nr:CRISPR-associated endonuclease/helicase Cas3 [Chloroflexota bacterium]
MRSESAKDFWAKDDGETLLEHTLNVIRVTQHVCAALPFPRTERQYLIVLLEQLAVFHDLGKCASGFQAALRRKSSWGHRHEILSTALATLFNPQLEPQALFAILTHHRNLPAIGNEQEKCLPDNELPFEAGPAWQEMLEELRQNEVALRALIEALVDSRGLILPSLALDQLDCLGLPEAWLRRSYQPRMVDAVQRRRASLLRGLLMTSDHMASAGKNIVPKVLRLADFRRKIEQYELGDKPIRPFQERCGQLDGDIILKAPTGSGKTFAAGLWAIHNQTENGRLFYVLPHTASINAMSRTLQKWFPPETVGILHHRNVAFLFEMIEDDNPLERAKMARLRASLTREIYHPIRVCTPHQLLRVALRGRGWELGLAEFPNACFVFDEVHAYDPLLVGLTIATARWLKRMGANFLFASATLPAFLEQLLIEALGITSDHVITPNREKDGDRQICEKIRHRVEVRSGTLLESLPQIAHEISRSAESALIVCNHVATSQTVWRALREEYDLPAALLHARFNSRDRARIEGEITGREPPQVLVATQAVEVSLNLNYGKGYIEPAPADALGQRFGRINRQGALPPAPVVVFEQPSAGHLYDEVLTQRTVELLAHVGLLTEQTLTEVVNEIYENGYEGVSLADYESGLSHPAINHFENDLIAGTHRDWVEDIIADKQVEVLPFELLPEYQSLIKERRYLEAGLLFVPIRLRQHFKILREGTLRYDPQIREWVTTLRYSSDSGLDLAREIDYIL